MKVKSIILFFFLCIAFFAKAQPNARLEYINRYKQIAVDEMQRTGIPASIKLAQGILESGSGTSTLARKANNHFGMKCGSSWRGPTYYIKDDDYDDKGQLIESCFRAYENAEASYIAHSEFLRDPNKAFRYGFLFRLDPKDYKKWAYGLKQSGYATSPTYAEGLISVIEQHKLNKYDKGIIDQLDELRFINDVKAVVAHEGQTPDEIAKKYNIKTKCILKYNEDLRGPNQPLKEGENVYIQRKRWFFRGRSREHYVKEGESMYSISQLYGLKKNRLYKRNRMDKGTEPATGQKIRLRGKVGRGLSPKLRAVNPDENQNTNIFDEGTGKVDHIDGTNVVNPNDLPATNGTTNPNNNTSPRPTTTTTPNANTGNSNNDTNVNQNNNTNTPSNNSNNNGGVNSNGNNNASNGTNGTNPSTNNNGGVGNANTNNGNDRVEPTKPATPATNTGSNTSGNTTKPNTTTTKPTTTVKPKPEGTGTTTTKPATNNNGTGAATTSPTIPTASGSVMHTVKTGDTLYSLARFYGVKVDDIKTLNNLIDNNIKVGQSLVIKK